MSKRLQQAIVIALFGLFVIWAGAFDKWSSSRQPSKAAPAHEGSESNQAHIEHSAVWDWIGHDAAGFFAFWLVIVGAGQAGLFYWQLTYMRKSIGDTKALALAAQASAETAKEQVIVTKMGVIDLERAYLDGGPTDIITGFVTDPVPAKGFYQEGVDPMEIVITLGMTNTGRTRAAIIRAYGEFSHGPLGEKPIYSPVVGTTYVTDVSMGAGGTATFPHQFKTRHIGEQFFFGFVEYRDIFKNLRTTRFCNRIIPDLRNGQRGKLQFAGNDAWRECD